MIISEWLAHIDSLLREERAQASLFAVPQEPWPADGSLPRARELRFEGSHTVWTGEANGVTARCEIEDPDIVLYVKPTVEANGYHTRLVDASGVIYAWSFGRPL